MPSEKPDRAPGSLPGPCRSLTGPEIVRVINGMLFYLLGSVLGTRKFARQPELSVEELQQLLTRALLNIEAGYGFQRETLAELERTAGLIKSNPAEATIVTPIESLLKSSAQLFPAAAVSDALSWWLTSPNGHERLRLIAEYTKTEFETHAKLFEKVLLASAPGDPNGQ